MTSGTLPMLEAGDVALVAGISGAQVAAKRLADMGFVRGAEIEMVCPGSPCIVRIDSACVGLGAAHQHSIQLALP